jgi:hypothetical protein
MRCPQCNAENPPNAATCTHGRADLAAPADSPSRQGQAAPAAPAGIEKMIPTKNVPALMAYYLGLFSFIPLLGILLGIPAFVLGIMGLLRARAHPEARGKVHAWVGIIMGGLFGFGYLAAVILGVVVAIMEA